jgi:hypothetical protein
MPSMASVSGQRPVGLERPMGRTTQVERASLRVLVLARVHSDTVPPPADCEYWPAPSKCREI